MLRKIVFIVGPHGVGKTYVTTQIKRELDALHLDLGPIIRQIHQSESPEKTFIDWLRQGEEKYGNNFSDMILCREISEIIRKSSANTLLVTGSRSAPGLKYILDAFSIKNYSLIYLDAPKSLLKSNYEKREGVHLSTIEFEDLLSAENKMGLQELRRFIIQNPSNSFYIINKDNSPLILKKIKGIIFNMEPHLIKRSKFNYNVLQRRKKRER